MKNKNTFLIALILVIVAATSIFIFAGGINGKTGQSAYQLAVEKGYSGTESEWLEALKGANGQDGQSVNYSSMYETAQSHGYTGTFLEFVSDYLAANDENSIRFNSIQDSILSSVNIYTFYQRNGYGEEKNSAGAGFVYDVDDSGNMTIVTNYHVTYVSSAAVSTRKIYVSLFEDNFLLDRTTDVSASIQENCVEASYIGGNKEVDIAVIKINGSQKVKDAYAAGTIKKAEFADVNSDLAYGESCYTVGNPIGYGTSVITGVVSVPYEEIKLADIELGGSHWFKQRAIRISCNINPGNSGGALFDYTGKVIGVVNSRDAEESGEDIDGIGGAIPLREAYFTVLAILDNCDGTTVTKVEPRTLGIEIEVSKTKVTYSDGKVTTTEVSTVASIEEDSAALAPVSGTLELGDELKSFVWTHHSSGTTETIVINHYFTLSDYEFLFEKDDTIELTYSRVVGGTDTTGTVTLKVK
ncbi:MAG: trypsin-like peptidase domain-containing protein [Clostridia bacterium]|nr:trypsin-like peptidase domain-containing protein [Clostridia bacterium]